MEIDYFLITALRKMMALNVNISFKMEKQIFVDEFDDPEFLEFAIENYSKLFSYIASGRINIRICRDITRVEERLPSRHANENVFSVFSKKCSNLSEYLLY